MDRDQAAAWLYDWAIACIDSGVAELTRLARTVTIWRDEFLAYIRTLRPRRTTEAYVINCRTTGI